jgi:preprotein translocase SecE subunit
VAKTRAQRKAEQRRRQAEAARKGGGGEQSSAQHDTQVPESGEVAEAEAIMRTGAQPEELGEGVRPPREEKPPKAPAPSRADIGVAEEEPSAEAEPAPPGETRRERKRREREESKAKEERRRAREGGRKAAEAPERRRGPVIGFLASSAAELRRVQWPNRETLIQASTVTLVFVAVAAAYLGALDAVFNWLVKAIL